MQGGVTHLPLLHKFRRNSDAPKPKEPDATTESSTQKKDKGKERALARSSDSRIKEFVVTRAARSASTTEMPDMITLPSPDQAGPSREEAVRMLRRTSSFQGRTRHVDVVSEEAPEAVASVFTLGAGSRATRSMLMESSSSNECMPRETDSPGTPSSPSLSARHCPVFIDGNEEVKLRLPNRVTCVVENHTTKAVYARIRLDGMQETNAGPQRVQRMVRPSVARGSRETVRVPAKHLVIFRETGLDLTRSVINLRLWPHDYAPQEDLQVDGSVLQTSRANARHSCVFTYGLSNQADEEGNLHEIWRVIILDAPIGDERKWNITHEGWQAPADNWSVCQLPYSISPHGKDCYAFAYLLFFLKCKYLAKPQQLWALHNE